MMSSPALLDTKLLRLFDLLFQHAQRDQVGEAAGAKPADREHLAQPSAT